MDKLQSSSQVSKKTEPILREINWQENFTKTGFAKNQFSYHKANKSLIFKKAHLLELFSRFLCHINDFAKIKDTQSELGPSPSF